MLPVLCMGILCGWLLLTLPASTHPGGHHLVGVCAFLLDTAQGPSTAHTAAHAGPPL